MSFFLKNCFHITIQIESIQPIGKMDEILDQGVILYGKPNFASPGIAVTEGDGSGEAGSMIFVGPTSYLIEGGGKKICFRPGSTRTEYGYCLLPNSKASLGLEGSVSVKENGCSTEVTQDEIDIILENCAYNGIQELYSDQGQKPQDL